ncbi:MAG: hypothetical protein HYY35_07290 [Deltaproteobacteria bacterium]|nr:hypothetical protein [Deltaproteobacteria bacterium]
MPEAEDVLLDAAERASAAARRLWHRWLPPSAPGGTSLAERRRRLELLVRAAFDRDWPIVPCDAPPRPSWLARRLGGLAPWQHEPRAEAFSDGEGIFLPRRLDLSGRDIDGGELLRLAALTLGARLARGAIAAGPRAPLARDLHWIAEGALADAAVAAELPGLAEALRRARRFALARRPEPARLSARERAVEHCLRRVLEAALGDSLGLLPQPPEAESSAPAVAAWARRAAAAPPFTAGGEYRGVAPVPHWGCPRPDLDAVAATAPAGGERPPLRSRRLSRRIEARHAAAEQPSERTGPLVLPFGDPPQSVQDPAGLARPRDDAEDLDLDALSSELERLGEVSRVRDAGPVREVLEAESERRDAGGSSAARDPAPAALAYPEWDFRSGAYRPGYAVVRESLASAGDAGWVERTLDAERRLLEEVRRRFEQLRPRRERRRHERDGEEVDLDAYVEDFADRAAGRPASERLYASERPLRRDVSVALLVDATGSTESWASGSKRVIDVEKEAALVFCSALSGLGDRHAVFAFSGQGPRNVRVARIKAFGEACETLVGRRIAGAHGDGLTRLGAPLRHLTAALCREPSRVRLLLVLSDGKPNDEDEYAGLYGIEDTRQAAAEARLQGVSVFCLAVDRQASSYLPRMFGPNGYAVIGELGDLPRRLPEIYRRLTAVRGG